MMERRLGDRARRVEKTVNRQTGEEETQDNTFGIEDGMEEHFDREFQEVMQQGGRSQYGASRGGGSLRQQQQQQQIGYVNDGYYSQRQAQQQQRQQRGNSYGARY